MMGVESRKKENRSQQAMEMKMSEFLKVILIIITIFFEALKQCLPAAVHIC